MALQKLVIASQNAHKVGEIRHFLTGLPFQVISIGELDSDFPAIVEDAATFTGNARKKALETAQAVGELALADDSGLEVDALGGQPGVYSARFAGDGATDHKNNEKLLHLMETIPDTKRGAQFRCVIAIADPQGNVMTCEGICRGRIAREPRGKSGFGYDPLFIVPDYEQTFAELGEAVKNRISHRAEALGKAKKLLTSS